MRADDDWGEEASHMRAVSQRAAVARAFAGEGPTRPAKRDTWAIVFLVLEACLLACFLAGCGGGGGEDDSKATSSGDPTLCAPGQANCK